MHPLIHHLSKWLIHTVNLKDYYESSSIVYFRNHLILVRRLIYETWHISLIWNLTTVINIHEIPSRLRRFIVILWWLDAPSSHVRLYSPELFLMVYIPNLLEVVTLLLQACLMSKIFILKSPSFTWNWNVMFCTTMPSVVMTGNWRDSHRFAYFLSAGLTFKLLKQPSQKNSYHCHKKWNWFAALDPNNTSLDKCLVWPHTQNF